MDFVDEAASTEKEKLNDQIAQAKAKWMAQMAELNAEKEKLEAERNGKIKRAEEDKIELEQLNDAINRQKETNEAAKKYVFLLESVKKPPGLRKIISPPAHNPRT